MKRVITLSVACLAGILAGASGPTTDPAPACVQLWPSSVAELKPQRDSRLTRLADGAVAVATGTHDPWPGVRLDFAAGTCDLTPYGRIAIALSNTTDRASKVFLSVKGGAQGMGPGGHILLPPHGCGTLVAPITQLPWLLDAPLELRAMNGFPTAKGGKQPKGGGGFDLEKANSFHIFFEQDGVPRGFAVRRITLEGAARRPQLLDASTFLPFVDRFGQFKHGDWPGKIHSEAELKAARDREEAWLAAHAACAIPESDRYGGWAAGPQLKATGFFRTEKVKGKWWLVDPEGRLFFSHGVDCVRLSSPTGVGFRENYFEWVPQRTDPVFGTFVGTISWPQAHGFYREKAHLPYKTFCFARANARRKYGADWEAQSFDRAHRRLRAWGLNTIANWSDARICRMDRTPYTLCLGTGETPRLKGSTGWWGALPDPFHPEFERIFRARARDAASRMKNDPWCLGVFVDNELSWNREARMASVADTYFSTIRRVLREELPHHLYLGCRIAWGTDVIYRAAAKYCDVVSVNIYSRRPVRDLPSGAADKPMINGEFHFGALDRGLFHTGLVATRDQNARARCYRDFVTACLDHPRLVGTHWFQWQDQPLTGRGDGENYQIGFVTVTDTPYPELVAAARAIAATMYRRRYGTR